MLLSSCQCNISLREETCCYRNKTLIGIHLTSNVSPTNSRNIKINLVRKFDILLVFFFVVGIFVFIYFCWQCLCSFVLGVRRSQDRIVIAYHYWCCDFKSRSGRGVQHYVIKFVSDLRQVGGFLRVLRFPPPIKLTATI
jgi:hypothetical protein